LVVMG